MLNRQLKKVIKKRNLKKQTLINPKPLKVRQSNLTVRNRLINKKPGVPNKVRSLTRIKEITVTVIMMAIVIMRAVRILATSRTKNMVIVKNSVRITATRIIAVKTTKVKTVMTAIIVTAIRKTRAAIVTNIKTAIAMIIMIVKTIATIATAIKKVATIVTVVAIITMTVAIKRTRKTVAATVHSPYCPLLWRRAKIA
mgnify:CR=1 FL=1